MRFLAAYLCVCLIVYLSFMCGYNPPTDKPTEPPTEEPLIGQTNMNEFIETLQKHGYETTYIEDPDEGNGWSVSKNGHGIHFYDCNMIDGEHPWIAFWCLDEIERLGWHYSLVRRIDGGEYMNPDQVPTDYFVSGVRGVRRDTPRFESGCRKTKTEACMKALMAVLNGN